MGFLKTALAVALGLVIFITGCALIIAGGADEAANEIERTLTEGEEASAPKDSTGRTKVSTRCAYILDSSASLSIGGHFVGSIDAENTTDSDVRMRAVARWEQLGSEDIVQAKEFTVRAGDRRKVQFRVQATIDQISAHQSAEGGCRVQRKTLTGSP